MSEIACLCSLESMMILCWQMTSDSSSPLSSLTKRYMLESSKRREWQTLFGHKYACCWVIWPEIRTAMYEGNLVNLIQSLFISRSLKGTRLQGYLAAGLFECGQDV